MTRPDSSESSSKPRQQFSPSSDGGDGSKLWCLSSFLLHWSTLVLNHRLPLHPLRALLNFFPGFLFMFPSLARMLCRAFFLDFCARQLARCAARSRARDEYPAGALRTSFLFWARLLHRVPYCTLCVHARLQRLAFCNCVAKRNGGASLPFFGAARGSAAHRV